LNSLPNAGLPCPRRTAHSDFCGIAFVQIIGRELQVEQSQLVRQASPTDALRADSIRVVHVMLRLEEQGVNIPIKAAWEVETVGDAYCGYAASQWPRRPERS